LDPDAAPPFAIWLTGLPASGKSTVSAALRSELADRGINVAVLESDALRAVLTPHPSYHEQERELFYRQMAWIRSLLIAHGVSVIFDATANRRSYRSEARARIPRFLEVFIDTPLDVCISRDPKGIYRAGAANASGTVPGLHAAYEPPENPDIVIHQEDPTAAAHRIVTQLIRRKLLSDLSRPAGDG